MPEDKYPLPRYDIIFKTIFINDNDYTHMEKLLSECLGESVKIKRYLNPELSVRRKNERVKKLDCLVEMEGELVNLEVNLNSSSATRNRNFNYFTSFYSSITSKGNKYDTKTPVIHLSLNFGQSEDIPEKLEYEVITRDGKYTYIDNFKIIEINVDKYRKYWYDKDEKAINKNSYLMVLSMNKRELLLEYQNYSLDKGVGKIVSEVERLNNDEYFMANWDYELDEIRLRNTEIDCAKEEGISEGEHNKAIETAKNMLKKDLDISLISEVTGLSKEDIIKLKDEL